MLKIDINLATKRRKKRIIPTIVAIGVLFLALAYTWHNIELYRLNQSQIALYGHQLIRFENTLESKKRRIPFITEEGLKFLIDEVAYINGVIARETFSWTELLTNLEASVPPKVSIVQISPDFKDKTIRISGMARSMKDVLKFVDELDRSENFMDVFLLRHEEALVKKGARGKALVSFNISAQYVGGKTL
jgi:type IV pilus assembly protein PilN